MSKHPEPVLLDEDFPQPNPSNADATKSPPSEPLNDKIVEDEPLLRERLRSGTTETDNVKPKLWRVEIRDPRKSTRWRTLSEIDEDELAQAEAIRDAENKTNAPALIRIVRKTRF